MKDLFPDRDTLASQIARYNRELLNTSQRSAFPLENTEPKPAADAAAVPTRQTPLMNTPREARQEETDTQSQPDTPVKPAEPAAPPTPAPAPTPDPAPAPAPAPTQAAQTPPPSARETTREAPRSSVPLTDEGTLIPPPQIIEEGVYPPPPPTDYPRDSIGYLQVQVFTAREASPLEGAHIAVYETTDEGSHLVTAAQSDNSGFSPLFALPSVSRQLSQQPGSPHPYVPYAVTVNFPGYYRVRNESIPVFAGVISRQPIFLTPLPEMGADDNFEIVYSEYKPDELN